LLNGMKDRALLSTEIIETGKLMKFGSFEGRMEDISCPLCKGNEQPRVIFKSSEGVGFCKCRNCNLLYASPRFTEESMLQIYENEAFASLSNYEKWSYDEWKRNRPRSHNIEQQKLLLVKKHLSEGNRILDVGCGVGLFVFEANKSGFLCEGIEPSLRLSEAGRKALSVPVHNLQVEEFNSPYRFAGIIIWDVLEHVYDPVRMVKKCASLLDDKGFLFAQVPNHRGISNLFKTLACSLNLRKNFKHFGFPWHVYSFDRKSLSVLMNKAGLKPIHFESWSHLLKDKKNGLISQIVINVVRQRCLSDYVVCIAQKTDG